MDFGVMFRKVFINRAWRTDFYELLAERLDNGITLRDALSRMYARAEGRSPRAPQTTVLKEMLDTVDGGGRLADALGPYVSESEQMLIAAGENSGNLVENLALATKMISVVAELRSKIIKGVQTPALMFGVLYLFMVAMGAYFVPQLAAVSDPSKWTGAAVQMRELAAFCASIWVFVFPVLLILAGAALVVSLPYTTGRVRSFLDHLPPWSFYKLIQGGSWLMSFASLVRSGITHDSAMRALAEKSKPWLRRRLESALDYMSEGKNVGAAMRETGYGFPDGRVLDALEDYADLRNFDKALMKTSERWIQGGIKNVEKAVGLLQVAFGMVLTGSFFWLMIAVNAIQGQAGSAGHF